MNRRKTTSKGKFAYLDILVWFFIVCLFIWFVLMICMMPLFVIWEKIGAWRDRKHRAASIWQIPVSDTEFLRGCDITEDSAETEIALELRQELAKELSKWGEAITPEEIAPDMRCRELKRGRNSYDIDSFGHEAVRSATRQHPLPQEAFEQMIILEDEPRMPANKLFRNYLDIIMQYNQKEIGK